MINNEKNWQQINKEFNEIAKQFWDKQIGQIVYYVSDNGRKIYKTEINSYVFTNFPQYKLRNSYIINDNYKNVFNNKDDAYEYALKVKARNKIKFIE